MIIEYRILKGALLFTGLNLCWAFNPDQTKVEPVNSEFNIVKDTQYLTIPLPVKKTEIVYFQFSECMDEGEIIAEPVQPEYKNDSLLLRFSSWENCAAKFQLDYRIKQDSLVLNLTSNNYFIRKSKGRIDTVHISKDCICKFTFSALLYPVQQRFSHISIE